MSTTTTQETITYTFVRIVKQSDKAVCLSMMCYRLSGELVSKEVWMPKSQVKIHGGSETQRGNVEAPVWLMNAKAGDLAILKFTDAV